MKKIWFDGAWEDYLWWQLHDKKVLRKINIPLKGIESGGYDGSGKPEPFKTSLRDFGAEE